LPAAPGEVGGDQAPQVPQVPRLGRSGWHVTNGERDHGAPLAVAAPDGVNSEVAERP
jgi:hypothetical protein